VAAQAHVTGSYPEPDESASYHHLLKISLTTFLPSTLISLECSLFFSLWLHLSSTAVNKNL